MAATTTTCRVYRNNVEIFRVQFQGATEVSWTPPDEQPANYRFEYSADGASPEVPGQIARRYAGLVGHRR
jgi:hypothetical protein